ncbi:MAG: hypothetical protein IJS37_00480, partial [Bacilli bacterium]|nr:hypothetical protein [Bacilli bacterium]
RFRLAFIRVGQRHSQGYVRLGKAKSRDKSDNSGSAASNGLNYWNRRSDQKLAFFLFVVSFGIHFSPIYRHFGRFNSPLLFLPNWI